MKITRLQFIKAIFSGPFMLASGFMTGCRNKKVEKNNPKENPYEYDIERFKKVDENLILYKEIKPIDVNVDVLKSIAITTDDSIIAGGNKKIFMYSASGAASGGFSVKDALQSIAAETFDDIYIAFKDHLKIYDSSGNVKQAWSSLGEKAYITGIDVNKDYVAAADFGSKKIWLFNKKGNLIRFIGLQSKHRHGSGFRIPSPYFDVHFDGSNGLWAVNPGRHRLEHYSLDGTLISYWGKPSMNLEGFSGCCNPTHFAFLPDGNFITAEKGLVRIKIHDKNGAFKGVVASPDSFWEALTGLDMAVNSKGHIYVTDRFKKQIRIFVKK